LAFASATATPINIIVAAVIRAIFDFDFIGWLHFVYGQSTRLGITRVRWMLALIILVRPNGLGFFQSGVSASGSQPANRSANRPGSLVHEVELVCKVAAHTCRRMWRRQLRCSPRRTVTPLKQGFFIQQEATHEANIQTSFNRNSDQPAASNGRDVER